MRRWIRIAGFAAILMAGSTMLAGWDGPGAPEPLNPVPVLPEGSPSPNPPTLDPAPPTVEPAPVKLNPDPQNPTGRLIEVSIKKQRLTAWRDGKIVYRFVISTGRPGYETPAGHYAILEKYENRWSRLWSVWMPFAMRWHRGYFIHQLPHKDGSSYNIGGSKLGTPDSHGCVRVDVGDAELLFRWTRVGTPVWVH